MREFRLHLRAPIVVPPTAIYFPVNGWTADPMLGAAPQYGPGGFHGGLWNGDLSMLQADRPMRIEVHYQLHFVTGVADGTSLVGGKLITNPVATSDPNYAGYAGQWEEAGIGFKAESAAGGVACGSALVDLRQGDLCGLFAVVTPNGTPITLDGHHCHTWIWGRETSGC